MSIKHNINPEPLAYSVRGNTIETIHYGWICILNKYKKIIYKKGNILNKTFLRSSAKPIQSIPIIDNNLKISPQELAIACGSHTGSKKHIELLKAFLKKNDLKISDLQCGIHLPYDESEKKRLITHNLTPSPLHNNCSGKHIGMLSICKKNDWELKTYINPNHPLQQYILKKISELAETQDISMAVDGCGVPTFALSFEKIATIFSNFTEQENNNFKKIISCMTMFPYIVGGINQIDSEIMKASNGNLISKVGAEGLIVFGFNGNSAVIKIADGNQKIRSHVALKLLSELEWISEKRFKNPVIKEIQSNKIKNHTGKIVGKIQLLANI